jgi:hypothetical protein
LVDYCFHDILHHVHDRYGKDTSTHRSDDTIYENRGSDTPDTEHSLTVTMSERPGTGNAGLDGNIPACNRRKLETCIGMDVLDMKDGSTFSLASAVRRQGSCQLKGVIIIRAA